MKTEQIEQEQHYLKEFSLYLEELIFMSDFILKDVESIQKTLYHFYNLIKDKHYRFRNKFVLLFAIIKNSSMFAITDSDILKVLLTDVLYEINNFVSPDEKYEKLIISEKLFILLIEKCVGDISLKEFQCYKKYISFLQKNYDYYETITKKSDEFVRVDKNIINSFFGIMAELIINKDKLLSISHSVKFNDELVNIAGNIGSIINRINNFLSDINYVPLITVFKRYPFIIKDLAAKQNKKIKFVINDNSVVIEKQVAESLGDILIHLIKNSVDHGIEDTEERKKISKSETGLIEINAQQAGNYVFIVVKDDGRGLNKEVIIQKAAEKRLLSLDKIKSMSDKEIYKLIFYPGFSTTDKISDISGRGVGMDVVKDTIERIGGNIDISTELKKKTEIIMKIPFKTVITELLFVYVQDNIIALTLDYIENIVFFKEDSIIYENDKPVLFNYVKDIKIPIWQGPYYSDDINFSKYKCGIVFSIDNKYIFFPVIKILEQTQSIIKNYNYFGLSDSNKKYIIGYTIFNEQIVTIVEPDFNFL